MPTCNSANSIAGVRVFYRVVARHKLAIVHAVSTPSMCSFHVLLCRLTSIRLFMIVQEHGKISVMTGDGAASSKQ